MKIGIAINGLKSIDKLLYDVEHALYTQSMNDIFVKAARPLRKAMKVELYRASGSARLRESVWSVKRKKGKDPGVYVKPYGKRARKYGLPTNIGYLWTFGHKVGRNVYKGAKDQDWLQRSWNSSQGEISRIIKQEVLGMLNNVYNKYERNSRKESVSKMNLFQGRKI